MPDSYNREYRIRNFHEIKGSAVEAFRQTYRNFFQDYKMSISIAGRLSSGLQFELTLEVSEDFPEPGPTNNELIELFRIMFGDLKLYDPGPLNPESVNLDLKIRVVSDADQHLGEWDIGIDIDRKPPSDPSGRR